MKKLGVSVPPVACDRRIWGRSIPLLPDNPWPVRPTGPATLRL